MLIAAAALLSMVAVSAVNLIAYREAIVQAASHDLTARAEVASRFLEEPLRTLDFARIRRFGEECRGNGYELAVLSRSGGRIFDTRAKADAARSDWFFAAAACGENRVMLFRPQLEVLAPFHRSLWLFALAVLVGALGIFVFFFVTYRQRVRIRELKKVEKFRREFIADVSHEIKTPLTGILGAVDMLETEKIEGDESSSVLIDLIKKESLRLNGLVQSILDLARLEREGEVLELAEVDLAELVRHLAERYNVKILSEPLVFNCDARLIEQALANLIVNALRYSGTKDITVSLTSTDKLVRLAVEDHGIGIPPEHAERIFERFHRVDPARSAETGGAGLGLSIVRRIARLHGGEVTFSPVIPHGSRFELTLPR